MFRLTAASAYGSFVRRQALAAVKYKSTPEGTPAPDSDFTFGEDGSVQQYITLKANFEKNQKNQTITMYYSPIFRRRKLRRVPDGLNMQRSPVSTTAHRWAFAARKARKYKACIRGVLGQVPMFLLRGSRPRKAAIWHAELQARLRHSPQRNWEAIRR
jgi:hypothetical protein